MAERLGSMVIRGWLQEECGRQGGLMIIVSVSESSGLGLSSQRLSPPRCINGSCIFKVGGNPTMD